jgi:hypothetical protein
MTAVAYAIKDPRFFPTVIIVLQACAAARWAAAGSAWNAMYWAFAVGLNGVCTFGKLGQ